tara:strand:- start:314 stop:1198 length:885 start_codon:yes stop_codon:yes gene_type:complete
VSIEQRPSSEQMPVSKSPATHQETAQLDNGIVPSLKDSKIVVKIGGSTIGQHDTSLQDLVKLQLTGARPVVVHGGGKTISDWMQLQGIKPRFNRGLRVTDKDNIEIVIAVLTGLVNKSLVGSIENLGGKAIGLSGIDGSILEANPISEELGLVGEINKVNPKPIETILDSGYMPVIAPVAVYKNSTNTDENIILNVNADTVAGEIAAALNVQRLILMTDVPGVLDSTKRLIPRLTRRQANQLLTSNVIDGGMVPKIDACLKALEIIDSAHIIDGREGNTLLQVLENQKIGTRLD